MLSWNLHFSELKSKWFLDAHVLSEWIHLQFGMQGLLSSCTFPMSCLGKWFLSPHLSTWRQEIALVTGV